LGNWDCSIKFLLRENVSNSATPRYDGRGNNSTRSASEIRAGGSAIAAQKPPIVADWRMLFAEYPIVIEKFQMSDKFVWAAKIGEHE
jgi:hypothetical protein